MDNLKYTPLPSVIHRNGFKYIKVLQQGRKYIYCQYVTPQIKRYEVFVSDELEEKIIFNKHYPARHKFPSNEDFGKSAWTYRSMRTAIIKLLTLNS